RRQHQRARRRQIDAVVLRGQLDADGQRPAGGGEGVAGGDGDRERQDGGPAGPGHQEAAAPAEGVLRPQDGRGREQQQGAAGGGGGVGGGVGGGGGEEGEGAGLQVGFADQQLHERPRAVVVVNVFRQFDGRGEPLAQARVLLLDRRGQHGGRQRPAQWTDQPV